ncbi:hypothetical protein [Tessaracoccus lacteus]|uniref:Uncharacterized protein n=1 Tax=Tessaracoccus lacteus TaxID=3041766 RepID=A0ABY8PWR5_9ACTN|nr:hypothetical protein [Tessaracoccus sp. T21]WGT46868.1 hypothetical protein QH948_12120 [Tessaracoccus sp. T21]
MGLKRPPTLVARRNRLRLRLRDRLGLWLPTRLRLRDGLGLWVHDRLSSGCAFELGAPSGLVSCTREALVLRLRR